MTTIQKSLALTLAAAASCLTASAEDWPAWGGGDPGRNMYSPAKGFPAKFNPGKFKPNSEDIDLATTQNVKWVVKLGSQTYGNTVVANGKVLIGTNNATPRDARFKDDKSVLLCFNEYNGDFLWQLTVPKLASGKVNDWEYLGLLASPFR
jgi:outer membrane protein assembly factor BamB